MVLATPPVVRRGEIVQPSAAAMDAALRSLTDRSAAASTPVVLPPFATTVAYGPIFHPGSPTLAQAGVITIAAGEERRGIDVNLMLVPARAIEGRVLDPSGQPATQIQLFISGNGTPSPMFDAAPIMVAAERGDLRVAEALLRGGANPRRAVPVAEKRHDTEMVRLLNRYASR